MQQPNVAVGLPEVHKVGINYALECAGWIIVFLGLNCVDSELAA